MQNILESLPVNLYSKSFLSGFVSLNHLVTLFAKRDSWHLDLSACTNFENEESLGTPLIFVTLISREEF